MLKILINIREGGEELPSDISIEELGMLASTPALFGGARTFVLAGAAAREELLDIAEALVASPHMFIFEEEKLLKGPATALAKAGAAIVEAKVAKKEYRFDHYGVAAALGARDKKALWLALMRAFRAGEKAEALGGLLAWKARQMGDAALSGQLTYLYHDSHRGAGDLELLLERFALGL